MTCAIARHFPMFFALAVAGLSAACGQYVVNNSSVWTKETDLYECFHEALHGSAGAVVENARSRDSTPEVFVQTGMAELGGIAFSGDGKYAAVGSYSTQIKLWDVAARRELRSLQVGDTQAVQAVMMSGDGSRVGAILWSKVPANKTLIDTRISGVVYDRVSG